MRRAVGLIFALLTVFALAGPARAEVDAGAVASAWRSDPLYVDPDADVQLSAAEQAQLRDQLRDSSPRIYLALLPRSSGADIERVLRAAVPEVGDAAVYGGVTSRSLIAGSYRGALPSDAAARVAQEVGQQHGGTVDAAALTDFVDGVRGAASGGGSNAEPATRGNRGTTSPLAALVTLAVIGGVIGLIVTASRRRRRREEEADLAEVRASAEEDVTRLGEDITAVDVTGGPGVEDYRAALDSYDHAKAALAAARRPEDLAAVSEALEEGRWRLARVRAVLAGDPPPERRPPCFFNPQHGPSVTDIVWEPPGGAPREVPVCAADADRVQRGDDPDYRQVLVGGNRVPYWQAPPMWGPWAGGYYGGFGGMGTGLLGGLLLGSMLTPHAPVMIENNYYDGGGGDFGGGDFGGGDFGGGDFGGGDFGGGDFN
jgi:uncharacterized membrane protein YgcG